LSIFRDSKEIEKATFWKLDLWRGEVMCGVGAPSLFGPIERVNTQHYCTSNWSWLFLKDPNTVGISRFSSEGEKRFSFGKVLFSSYLEFRAMGKVQIPVIHVSILDAYVENKTSSS
jgi:hypothetical protein